MHGSLKRRVISEHRPLSVYGLIGTVGAGLALTIGVWLLFAFGNQWTSYSSPTPPPPIRTPGSPSDQIIAVVNGEPIMEPEWARTLSIYQTLSRLAGKAEPDPEEVLQQLIDQRLVLQGMKFMEPSVDQEAAARRLRSLLATWKASEQQLDEALRSAGLSREDVLREIQRLMLIEQALPKLEPSPEEWLAQQRARSRISVYRPIQPPSSQPGQGARENVSSPSLSLSPTPPSTGPYPGQQAPDFSLVDLNGKPIRLSDLRGRPVILHFWATWCPICRQETPALEAVNQRYRSHGVVLMGINVRERPENVQEFARSSRLTFPVLIDSDGSVAGRYQVTGIPTTLVIDSSGVVRFRHVGPIREEQWEEYLTQVLSGSGKQSSAEEKLAPDFALPRESGEIVRLSDYRGRSKVVLVFYRSPT